MTSLMLVAALAVADSRIESLIARMTVEEKVAQIVQPVFRKDGLAKAIAAAERGEFGTCIWFPVDAKGRNAVQRAAVERTRLGIPVLFCHDVIHGEFLTFPIAPALAGSFEPELFERAQSVAARQASAHGLDLSFAPMCDLAEDPRWGRVAETCGEDPYLTSLCVAAQVHGFQGDDPSAPDRVAACLKHFCGYGASRGGRDYHEAEISEWTLWNHHLPPFVAGVRADALSVMSSFNTLDGVPLTANRRMLTDVLRGTIGFGGCVIGDWGAVAQLVDWGFASDRAEASVRALSAGNDIDMVSPCYTNGIPAAIANGTLPMSVLDEAVRRVLRLKERAGLFDRPYVDETRLAKDADWCESDRKLALECAEKSVVLLRNDGVLPLASGGTVALIGPVAESRRELIGCWAAHFDESRATSLAEALRRELPNGTDLLVAKGCGMMGGVEWTVETDGSMTKRETPDGEDDRLWAEAMSAADRADVVVMAIGEGWAWTGENGSRHTLGLTGRQQALFDAVAAKGKKIVSVVFAGRPLALPEVYEKSDAVLYAWQPGAEGGHALARLLVGKAMPSARLTMSVPEDIGVLPVNYNHPSSGHPTLGGYREYAPASRWENRAWGSVPARFPFGFGLTYTTFAYSDARVEKGADGFATAVVTVRNTGSRAGVETVQLYVRQVACAAGVRPVRELRGFRRVTLASGEGVDVRFPISDETLGYVDRAGGSRTDAGAYKLWIAPDAVSGLELDLQR